ncbi:MAG: hypothetical protein E6Q97_38600 [Desulfurellales bacterium]|nr:MAG: hypothetical protein E6Q97_38600 [Desulfurellales bacterium]
MPPRRSTTNRAAAPKVRRSGSHNFTQVRDFPRELARAQGFPDDYLIDLAHRGKPLSATAQVRMIGNSVCPPLAAAIVAANYTQAHGRMAA